jgi:hypothetical protein
MAKKARWWELDRFQALLLMLSMILGVLIAIAIELHGHTPR